MECNTPTSQPIKKEIPKAPVKVKKYRTREMINKILKDLYLK